MRAGFVQIDPADPVYPCLLAEGSWNGWALPFFTADVAMSVVAEYGWDPTEEGEWELVAHDGDIRYGVGAGAWTWYETTEEGE